MEEIRPGDTVVVVLGFHWAYRWYGVGDKLTVETVSKITGLLKCHDSEGNPVYAWGETLFLLGISRG